MLSKQIIIISLIIPFIEYYGFVAVRKSTSRLNHKLRKSLMVFYILLSIAVFWALFSFRMWATTTWPSDTLKLTVNIFMGVFFGKFVIALVMFMGDIYLLLRNVGRFLFSLPERIKGKNPPGNRISRSQFISRAALLCGAAMTAGLGYGMANKYKYRIHKTSIPLNGLPEVFRQLKIIQISDIHAGSFDNTEAVLNGINMIVDEKPDLILFTGDLVNYRTSEMTSFMDIFKKLKAPLGIYSILGNHDYSDYLHWPSENDKRNDFLQMINCHKDLGWKLLRNEYITLNFKGSPFAIIGSENWSIKDRFPKYGDLNKAMAGLNRADIPLKILMTHDPSHWDAKVRPNFPDIQLTLSGHTHGMQLGIEIPGIKWSPSQYLYKQWAGLYQEKDQFLYVNRGFGFIGYDGRLGIMPEIAVLEFS